MDAPCPASEAFRNLEGRVDITLPDETITAMAADTAPGVHGLPEGGFTRPDLIVAERKREEAEIAARLQVEALARPAVECVYGAQDTTAFALSATARTAA